ncbi:MAG: hypothetical protein Q8M17_03235 [Actinomycetota bacterium]|nr:hypothetical protein [Actinomycetota bacterium]
MTATPAPDLLEVDRELQRVVDRLTSLPLAKVPACSDDVFETAAFILAQARRLGAVIPPDVTLPRLGANGLGAMLAVVGSDFLETAKAAPEADVQPVLDRLVALRRSLP